MIQQYFIGRFFKNFFFNRYYSIDIILLIRCQTKKIYPKTLLFYRLLISFESNLSCTFQFAREHYIRTNDKKI